jgi:hypothetical protein
MSSWQQQTCCARPCADTICFARLHNTAIERVDFGRRAGVNNIALWRATRRTSTLILAGKACHLQRILFRLKILGYYLFLQLNRGARVYLTTNRYSIPCIAAYGTQAVCHCASLASLDPRTPMPAAQEQSMTLP